MGWIYNNLPVSADDIPEGSFGFIYSITQIGVPASEFGDVANGRDSIGKVYIGKKQLGSLRKKLLTKKEKLLPENKRKKYKYVASSSDWLTYNSSCVELKKEIERIGEQYFKKEILLFCEDKINLSYWEEQFQRDYEVLFIDSFNSCIGGTYYRGKIKDYSI